jgi:hypothetical protein
MMSSEQRLDRLERIAMLMVRAGARVRREQNEKINIIIDAQIRNEDRFARNEERFARNDERLVTIAADLARSHSILAESLKELAKAQIQTEKRLDSLIEAIDRDRNGNSS